MSIGRLSGGTMLSVFGLCVVLAVCSAWAAAEALTERAASSASAGATEAASDEVEVRRAAIFVRSRVPELDGKIGTLQDLINAYITSDARFSIISRENVVSAVGTMRSEDAEKDRHGDPEEHLDHILSERASALQLGRLMGADYLLIVSINSFNQDTRHVRNERLGIDERVRDERVRLSYEILGTSLGGTLAAATVHADKRTSLTGYEQEPDNVDELLNDAAQDLAQVMARQVKRSEIRQREAEQELVELTIVCTIEDLAIPDVVRNEDGEWVVDPARYPMQVMDVTVELAGVVEGSAPGTIRVEPGLRQIRLSRAGFRDWERHINVRDGMELNVALQMTDENRRRMKEDMAFFEQLRIDQKLTDGELDALKGYAQMLRQSGYRIDVKQDITIDTDEAPTFEKRIQSFWAN